MHLSHRYLAHPKAFTVAAIIPMIPGVYAYRAMISMVQIHHYGYSHELLEQMISSFINTAFILGALVFGLALPGLIFIAENLWYKAKNTHHCVFFLSLFLCDFFIFWQD
ncbi:putative transmembrane protein [Rodentibacter pneumotropicus]|uniref:Putative transmembrane protein n=1 Tax=Rodentibacter pneumotropicus TaxID=758 RepID=A0A448MMC0_9PAST|nr:putative transmembrane protein [Rodentibacter pneumotropicus]